VPLTGILQLLERMFLRARGLLGQKFSVRWKLTILYGLMVTLTLGAVGITLWLALQVQTQATIDSDLQSAAGLIANNNGAAQVGPEYTRPKRWDCAYAVPIVQSYCAQVQQKLDNFATQVFAAGHGPGQFEQVQIFDRDGGAPLLAPRLLGQGVSLQNMFASMGANELTSLLTTRVPRYRTLTISENGRHVLTRVLFTPLQLPPTLARRGDSAVIEVFQVESTFIEIKQVTRFVGRQAEMEALEEAFITAAAKESACPSKAQGGDLGVKLQIAAIEIRCLGRRPQLTHRVLHAGQRGRHVRCLGRPADHRGFEDVPDLQRLRDLARGAGLDLDPHGVGRVSGGAGPGRRFRGAGSAGPGYR